MSRYANAELAGPTAKYMKDQFSFLGMRAPQLQAATKEINHILGVPDKSLLHPVIEALWEMPEREYQYLGTSLLGNSAKMFDEADIELLEFSITHKPWWDTIDVIAKYPVGDYFIKFPHLMENRLNQWLDSGNMWLQRTAILCQLGWKGKTCEDVLYKVIEYCIDPAQCTNADEFFVRKAIGWALREYSKTNPQSVEAFAEAHPEMSGLSKREAMKVILKQRNQ
ncbi:hypothetical protein AN477_16090 [Alicyclobacillus ferrooxydans]|uniref:DNA alkylation repair protein n=1 Tax=Alicyclobacillus ferrooxydans TaxID=471514 RepID=A0A0P9CB70_9BACL|nr:hypothetical protein AN477_16090 [Alicyclobacillus ferrooxydans]